MKCEPAWSLAASAKDGGFDGPLFGWDEDRRLLIRVELDAAFFHPYMPADANGEWVKAESETDEDLKRLKASFAKPRDAVGHMTEMPTAE